MEYVRPGGDRAWSRIEATRIAELDDPGSPNEREKPIGNDSGFLWRMNLYWRYVQVDSGVLVECEQLTLSLSIRGPSSNGTKTLCFRTVRGQLDLLNCISRVFEGSGLTALYRLGQAEVIAPVQVDVLVQQW